MPVRHDQIAQCGEAGRLGLLVGGKRGVRARKRGEKAVERAGLNESRGRKAERGHEARRRELLALRPSEQR